MQRLVGFGEGGLHGGHVVTEGGGLPLGLGGVRTGRLQLADFLRLPVPLSAGGIDLGGELAPQCVRFQAKRRAVQWLADNSLIAEDAANRFLVGHPDPDLP